MSKTKLPPSLSNIVISACRGSSVTPEEFIRLMADRANWVQITQNQRCYWSFVGPFAPPWEYAGYVLRDHIDNEGA